MAYNTGTKYSGGKNVNAGAGNSAAVTTKSTTGTLFQTGLWVQEKGPALASVQVREAVTIPAGAYINMFDNRETKQGEKQPDFKITVRPGKLKG